jgi:crotonobetainyl-CoA:carnitine CoA-transferase CaiB-like acyl-CoA transferase
MPGPLAGLRVLELARILAGPWAGQMLADLGADVVKVERKGTGDDTRGWGPSCGRTRHRASYSDRQNGGAAQSIADDHGIQ